MAQGYLAQVQALIAQRMKENPEEMKRKLKEIEEAKKKAKEAPKSPPKPSIDPQLTRELIEELAITTWERISFEKVKYLIERGADIKAEREAGFSALYVASYFGDIELVKECLQAGMDVSGNKEITPLHWAVYRDNIEMAKFLIDSGADVNAKNEWGFTPLDWVESEEMRALLIKYGAIE
jgi:ankyrin repeat protein